MCVISFASCWSVFPSDLAMAPSVRRAFWETAGETSELAKARSSNASVDSLEENRSKHSNVVAIGRVEKVSLFMLLTSFLVVLCNHKIGEEGGRERIREGRKKGGKWEKKEGRKTEEKEEGKGEKKGGRKGGRERKKGGKRKKKGGRKVGYLPVRRDFISSHMQQHSHGNILLPVL